MKRAYLVAKRELLENIKTKGFWLGILMMPVMLSLVVLIPLFAESTKEVKIYSVIDQSGLLLEGIHRGIEISDLKAVFKSNHIPEQWDKSPRVLKAIREQVLDMSDLELTLLVEAIVDKTEPDRQDGLPESLSDLLSLHGRELSHWWYQLDPESRNELSPSISSQQFQFRSLDNETIEGLNKQINDGALFAYFVIGSDPLNSDEGFRYVSNNLTDQSLPIWYSGLANGLIQKLRMQNKEIDPEVAAWINKPVKFEGRQISDEGTEESVQTDDIVRQWAPVALVYLLWIAIMVNTQVLLTNTIEEKSNKLIEVLLSSVSPLTLMSGKIMGIAATGLLMVILWGMIVAIPLALLSGDGLNPLPVDLVGILQDPAYWGSFLVYFILGFLFYASLLVGLGSVCNNLKDAQNLTLPVQMVQIVPLLIMVPIVKDPNGLLAQIMSWIPPFTPYVMMNRAASPPTTPEYIGTSLLLIASVIFALWFAAKIFRVGILLTGNRPGVMEMMRWLKTPLRAPPIQLEKESIG